MNEIDLERLALGRPTSADEKADTIARFGPDWARMVSVLAQTQTVARSRDSGARKYIRLTQIADEFSAVVAPYVACRGRGCSHCCKMAVNMTEREAILIGRYLKRAPVKVPVENNPEVILAQLDADVDRYAGKACPMLAPDGSCTVYPVRPLACRLQHSLEDDPEPCNLDTGRHWVKRLDTMPVSAVAVYMDINRAIGDIRDFFP